MTSELFTFTGERKYLTEAEREAFIAAALQHERGEVRTFGLVLPTQGPETDGHELTRAKLFLS
ncbi:MAG: hypothetical protein V2J55_18410 [Candidatus Competibacteraceae bacterium]|jgi:hypothetical protein|nr:hypothetical protein [Candidatus Competibacteraceae bacterium]